MTLQKTPNRLAKNRLFKTCAMAAGLSLMSLQAFAGDSALTQEFSEIYLAELAL